MDSIAFNCETPEQAQKLTKFFVKLGCNDFETFGVKSIRVHADWKTLYRNSIGYDKSWIDDGVDLIFQVEHAAKPPNPAVKLDGGYTVEILPDGKAQCTDNSGNVVATISPEQANKIIKAIAERSAE